MAKDFRMTVEEKARLKGLSAINIVSLADVDISAIDKAVIFYHGLWSRPSVMTFDILCESLFEVQNALDLIVVNADELNNASDTVCSMAKKLFGNSLGAYGETCWIRNGEITNRTVLYWKDYEQSTNHETTGNSSRKREATTSEIKHLILENTKALLG